MTNIKVLMVNYNNPEYSKYLIDSLRSQKGGGRGFALECIIVDNSTDTQKARECEELLNGVPWGRYIKAPANLGFFGGVNHGMSLCDLSNCSYLIICNNDLQFNDNFCSQLAATAFNDRIMAVCPDVITADGLHQNPHILKRISSIRRFQFDMYFSNYWVARLLVLLLRFIRPVKASREQTGEAHEMHMGVGACYILTSRFLARFKQLNYPHFLYGEEAYISDQIHTAGGILWYDPALCVHHAESAALSKIPRREAYEYERVGYPNYRSLL